MTSQPASLPPALEVAYQEWCDHQAAPSQVDALGHSRAAFLAGAIAERRRVRQLVHGWLMQICATHGERSKAAAAVRSIYSDLAPGYTVLRCAWPGGCPASVSAGTDTEARQLAVRAGWLLGDLCNQHNPTQGDPK